MRVGIKVYRPADSSAQSTRGDFTDAPKPIRTTLESRASRQRPPLMEGVRMCQCRPGELCRLATVSRPEFCVRVPPSGARANSPQDSGAHRLNDLIKSAKEWRRATISKFALGSPPVNPYPATKMGNSVPEEKRKLAAQLSRPEGRMRPIGARPKRDGAG